MTSNISYYGTIQHAPSTPRELRNRGIPYTLTPSGSLNTFAKHFHSWNYLRSGHQSVISQDKVG
ncbi:hypothetical protein L873DRAFT_1818619 [Choiromyces venosus 120613-1]|uniref:Uncharacterized protein n=1 Tax=Choiromyces venosus 120613-1 TaxID=1336337 RepID=A0A3N4J0I3_9PEZI|nr:hypothetical protein L873DRAFT_1818619 [Choiromyces venosus 120613-1]